MSEGSGCIPSHQSPTWASTNFKRPPRPCESTDLELAPLQQIFVIFRYCFRDIRHLDVVLKKCEQNGIASNTTSQRTHIEPSTYGWHPLSFLVWPWPMLRYSKCSEFAVRAGRQNNSVASTWSAPNSTFVDDSTHADTIRVKIYSTCPPKHALCTLISDTRTVECNCAVNCEVSWRMWGSVRYLVWRSRSHVETPYSSSYMDSVPADNVAT
jgi:hypothetical protein